MIKLPKMQLYACIHMTTVPTDSNDHKHHSLTPHFQQYVLAIILPIEARQFIMRILRKQGECKCACIMCVHARTSVHVRVCVCVYVCVCVHACTI